MEMQEKVDVLVERLVEASKSAQAKAAFHALNKHGKAVVTVHKLKHLAAVCSSDKDRIIMVTWLYEVVNVPLGIIPKTIKCPIRGVVRSLQNARRMQPATPVDVAAATA